MAWPGRVVASGRAVGLGARSECGSKPGRYRKADLRRWGLGCSLAVELGEEAQSVAVSGRGLALGGGA
ncbi:hypothetical protein P7K49_021373 [Saguinus oedipus]|uniref:Uncharacterized protein n=1 Tax=Saguinus oedipus TaxID=9490 RepID=A0ABQ9USI1_SAGOE|nr:hypothetical protein P7K49_021373 [Saguinus oedipus]